MFLDSNGELILGSCASTIGRVICIRVLSIDQCWIRMHRATLITVIEIVVIN